MTVGQEVDDDIILIEQIMWDYLAGPITGEDYVRGRQADQLENVLAAVRDMCTDDEGELDADEYIGQLEQTIRTLDEQRHTLLIPMEVGLYGYNTPSPWVDSPWKKDAIKKMVLKAATHRMNLETTAQHRFYTEEEIDAALAVYAMLPVVWRDAAAEFIELYTGNFRGGEFKTKKA